MGIRFINNGKGGSSGVSLNVFMQENEPTEKNGIWFKANKEYKEIITDKSIYASEAWNLDKIEKLKAIPYQFKYGSAVAVGTDIYLFGSDDSSYYTTAYKYNTLTDTYTKLTNIPSNSFYSGSAVVIGTDVYLLGGVNSNNRRKAYKYDTLSNIYTSLTNIPYDFYQRFCSCS